MHSSVNQHILALFRFAILDAVLLLIWLFPVSVVSRGPIWMLVIMIHDSVYRQWCKSSYWLNFEIIFCFECFTTKCRLVSSVSIWIYTLLHYYLTDLSLHKTYHTCQGCEFNSPFSRNSFQSHLFSKIIPPWLIVSWLFYVCCGSDYTYLTFTCLLG